MIFLKIGCIVAMLFLIVSATLFATYVWKEDKKILVVIPLFLAILSVGAGIYLLVKF